LGEFRDTKKQCKILIDSFMRIASYISIGSS
jgi:hypothetical protein